MIAYREKLTLPTFSPQEYLAYERQANSKHEYFEGNIIAMAGGSAKHNIIAANLLVALTKMFDNAGRDVLVIASDQRVQVTDDGPYFYPDICAVCAPMILDEADCLHNPYVIVEVLSESTSSFDRRGKFDAYSQMPSLRHYILIAQDRVHVEHFARQSEDQWELVSESERSDEVIHFTDFGTSITVAEVYRRISFV